MAKLTDSQKILLLKTALNNLVGHSLSNRGTEHVFVNCYTYSPLRGKLPKPYQEAEDALRACEA